MKKYKVATAPFIVNIFMNWCGFFGWTSFWRVIYIRQGHMASDRLIRHEQRHAYQIERDGRILFSIKYLYWLAVYGYKNNPYEIDAREAENELR